jgi:hypothetical protein
MVPFPMLPTASAAERRLYEGFLEQLAPEYVVYHSVDWVLGGKDGPSEGEADFVIAHPVDGVLVLEAKGGRLTYDTTTRRWTQSGHSGPHTLAEDPFHQARDEMYSLREILSAQEGWVRWMPSYGYGVAMPDGSYVADAHPAAPHEVVVDHDDMDRLALRIAEIMRYWRRPNRTFGAEGMEALARALGFAVEIRTPLKLEFDEEDRKIVELTADQAWILSFIAHRQRAVVTGPAGSGKTLLAIQIARRLADTGKPTLLTCFNKRLAEYLRTSTEGVEHVEVSHFHELCVQMAREAGLPLPPASVEPGSAYFERELPVLLGEAAAKLGPRYEGIVVDEAQDFREWWWPSLLALHRHPTTGRCTCSPTTTRTCTAGRCRWRRPRRRARRSPPTSATPKRSTTSSRSSTRVVHGRRRRVRRVARRRSSGTGTTTTSRTCSPSCCGTSWRVSRSRWTTSSC